MDRRAVPGRIAAVVAALLVIAPAAPASAHGAAIAVTVDNDGRGAVWVDVAWADGHPVTEPIAATMTALADDSRQIGPVALRGTPPTVAYPGALPAGTWQVVVDVALPGLAHCAASVVSTAPGTPVPSRPTPQRCGDRPATAAGPAPSRGPNPIPYAVAGALLVVAAAVVVTRRRRRSAPPVGARRR